jgi:hypothetical protein
MNRSRMMALGLAIALTLPLLFGAPAPAEAQAKPDGEMRFAMYVTISPTWFDPGEVTGFITPFWLMGAMHDALVKTMPGKAMAPSRMRFAMIYDYVWPSGVGPRVAEPALLLIDPYPWAAPYEELRLKK